MIPNLDPVAERRDKYAKASWLTREGQKTGNALMVAAAREIWMELGEVKPAEMCDGLIRLWSLVEVERMSDGSI